MADNLIEIPVSIGDLLVPTSDQPARGGPTRVVPLVPIGNDQSAPCVWKSHEVTRGLDNSGNPIRVNECLLLISRNPVLTIRAEVEVDAWKNFPNSTVEW